MIAPTFMECAEVAYGRHVRLAVRSLVVLAGTELVLIGFLLGMAFNHFFALQP